MPDIHRQCQRSTHAFKCFGSTVALLHDYFTKWVEATSYSRVTRSVVVRFIKKEIIFWYGLPRKIITDNATNLNSKMMKELCEDFKIQHHNSMPYWPKDEWGS